ncbi:hypothetical protein DPMN_082017 [Dreissena polymorpha]|uniref:mannosyl-oligosaccharide glucosidase n=1 Tax=Dreissena polymorpha TaxID=45954 RepID=A0A9D3Y666_DREPO|nr:hypothetical protein DPMN_082017 [Dreissena polymorpha]
MIKWDPEISKHIVSHWLYLMNTEGLIPREQIIGAGTRDRVLAEVVVQRYQNANPPTFIIPMKTLVPYILQSAKEEQALKQIMSRLKTSFNWYNTTPLGLITFPYRITACSMHFTVREETTVL